MANVQKTLAPQISLDAPWTWLAAGWRDLTRAPLYSLGYGAIVVGGGALITYGLWRSGFSALIPVALGIFALIGPLSAVGLYEISRRLEKGEPLSIAGVFLVKTKSPAQIALVGFFIMFASLVWMLLALVLYAVFSSSTYTPLGDFLGFALSTPAGITMLAIGSLIGGAIAFCIYMLTVFSIPMLMDQNTDVFTAINKGITAVRKNPAPMLLWAWLIAIITAAGVATFFVGLVIAFPLLGHASWHAYRDAVGSA
jgi:uncharacterized membrane protein